jgi:hypothetical protein
MNIETQSLSIPLVAGRANDASAVSVSHAEVKQ